MGSAIIRGAVKQGILPAREILAIDPAEAALAAAREIGVETSRDAAAAGAAPLILIAVKPQAFPAVAAQLAPIDGSAVVVSIMAGLESGAIRTALGGEARVVRAMPNIACQIGCGMTAVALGAGARRGDEREPLRLFSAIGRAELVEEGLMHSITAVSGSGPAYLFHLAEAMESAAHSLGLSAEQARSFVAQTLLGAAQLLTAGRDGASALRQAVTSKGGTTEAALDVMQRRGFAEVVRRAIVAAHNRAVELSKPAPTEQHAGGGRATESEPSRRLGYSEEETRA
jgi:pyrroline-5-carboxylate reductase